MIVYGELLFMENMIIGGVLLYLTGEICGRCVRSGESTGSARKRGPFRMAVGAALCGAFSLVIFLPVRMPVTLLTEAAFAVAVCAVVFGCGRDAGDGGAPERGIRRTAAVLWRAMRRLPWQKALIFLLATYFMGGITMGLLLVTDNTGIYAAAGIYTGDMKAGLLALFVGISFVTVKQIIRTVKAGKFYSEHVFPARITVGDRTVETMAFLDTGNSLREPVSGRPVAVADSGTWQQMEAAGLLMENRCCIVPYETVGGRGILTAVRTDRIEANGRKIKKAVVAKGDAMAGIGKSEHSVSDLYPASSANIGLLLSKDMF